MNNNENKLETKGLTLGQAIEHLNEGRMIAREGLNGKGLFVFKQITSRISVDVTVPKMQSLPQAVKDLFKARKVQDDNLDLITYENQLVIVNKDNVINNWSPSVSDTLAIDWYVYDNYREKENQLLQSLEHAKILTSSITSKDDHEKFKESIKHLDEQYKGRNEDEAPVFSVTGLKGGSKEINIMLDKLRSIEKLYAMLDKTIPQDDRMDAINALVKFL